MSRKQARVGSKLSGAADGTGKSGRGTAALQDLAENITVLYLAKRRGDAAVPLPLFPVSDY
jgi:hypothetical protein